MRALTGGSATAHAAPSTGVRFAEWRARVVLCRSQLVDVVVRNFGGFFPELVGARDTIFAVISEEETSFGRTLVKGIERFKKVAESTRAEGGTQVSRAPRAARGRAGSSHTPGCAAAARGFAAWDSARRIAC